MSNQELLIQKIKQAEESGYQQQKQPSQLFKILVFETLGTALFAYGIVASRGNDYLISLYLFAGIFFASKFTGGHLNPAVTLSFYSANEMKALTMRTYWLGQLGGALLGGFLALIILGELNSPHIPEESIQWMFADFCGETLGTFIFVLFIHIQTHPMTALTDNSIIGIGIIVLALFYGRILTRHSGGCLNPALGISLEVFQSLQDNDWSRMGNVWVLVFGPFLGGQLAQEFYNNFYVTFLPRQIRDSFEEKQEQEKHESNEVYQ